MHVAGVTVSHVLVPKVDADGELHADELEPLDFRLQEISLEEFQACRRDAEPVDGMRKVIYAATIPPDRARLWDNGQLQRYFGVEGPLELVRALLPTLGDVAQTLEVLNLLLATRIPRPGGPPA